MDNQDSKEVKIVLIIVLSVIVFLSLIIGVGYFVGRDSISSDEEDYIRDASPSDENLYYEKYKEYIEEYDVSPDDYYTYDNDFVKQSNINAFETSVEQISESKEILLFAKNISDKIIPNATFYVVLFDEEENIINVMSGYAYSVEPDDELCLEMGKFTLNYSSFKVFVDAQNAGRRSKGSRDDFVGEISKDENKYTLTVTNNGTATHRSVSGVVVFYDENDRIVDSSNFWLDKIGPNESETESLYVTVPNVKYKIFYSDII